MDQEGFPRTTELKFYHTSDIGAMQIYTARQISSAMSITEKMVDISTDGKYNIYDMKEQNSEIYIKNGMEIWQQFVMWQKKQMQV